ncbi:2'-5' RNA ligase family protein [Asanoa ishikariensis]|uniref:2'-5' RNA ligase family protein n=1 Tax=Asanoa ishikariensis TaxID=137265 RepID=UPI0015A115A5|nr:2'-5' RNA ligase family protein [Asanoa ishikariensis]
MSSLHVGRAPAAGVNTRLARPETYHLTLAFLGEVPDERLADVEEAVGQAVDRYHARAETMARRAARTRERAEADRGPGPAVGAEDGAPGDRGPRPAVEAEDGAPGDRGPRPAVWAEDGAPGDRGPGRAVRPEDRVFGDAEAAARISASAEVGVARRRAGGGPWPEVPELSLSGGGRFGRGAFALMWVGVAGDLEPMRALHKALRRELKHARFPYDERPWKPHLTLARPGDRIPRADLDADRAALDAYVGPVWPARELSLMRSNLGPDPSYDRLANWLL